jgi:hypothetical protein
MPDTRRLTQALALLHQNARPAELAGMARFGIVGDQRLGLSVPAMRGIARTLGRDPRVGPSPVGTPPSPTPASSPAWWPIPHN